MCRDKGVSFSLSLSSYRTELHYQSWFCRLPLLTMIYLIQCFLRTAMVIDYSLTEVMHRPN